MIRPIVIQHLTPHLGGGVGRVLLNYLRAVKSNPAFVHKVICLDYANPKAIASARETGFVLQEKMAGDCAGVFSAIEAADIVLVHWWNHPLLFDFLVRESLPQARVVFWSHISGFHSPYVFSDTLLNYPDRMVLTTPASLETQEVKKLQRLRPDAVKVIWSTGGIEDVMKVKTRPHEGTVVGYIGTVDYSKMHPSFIRMSSAVDLPDVKFVVCGGPGEQAMAAEAQDIGAADKFEFAGQVEDVPDYLSRFDVFGYPLSPHHYGTCEQALCEAMAAGVPPVVFANRAELQIVQDGVNGLVVHDEQEYSRAIVSLGRDAGLRNRLSAKARETAQTRFTIEEMILKWELAFDEVLNLPRHPRAWSGRYHGPLVVPAQVFLESLGDYSDVFARSFAAKSMEESVLAQRDIKKLYESSQIWKARTRGTPRHYNMFFPDDRYIRLWQSLGSDGKGNPEEYNHGQ